MTAAKPLFFASENRLSSRTAVSNQFVVTPVTSGHAPVPMTALDGSESEG